MSPICFTDLPRENRDMIYKMVFGCICVHPNYRYEEPVADDKHNRKRLYVQRCLIEEQQPEHAFPNELLALFLVNRQISAEAILVFYEKTLFTGTKHSDDGLLSFIRGSGSHRVNMIRTLEFGPLFFDKLDERSNSYDLSLIFKAIDRLQNLRTLKR